MGLKKKTRSESGSYPGFIKKTRNLTHIKTRYPKITKIPYIYIYIYTYNVTLTNPSFLHSSLFSSLPPSVRQSLSLISAQSHTPTLHHPHSHTPTLPHTSLPQSDPPFPSVQHSLSVTPTLPQSLSQSRLLRRGSASAFKCHLIISFFFYIISYFCS